MELGMGRSNCFFFYSFNGLYYLNSVKNSPQLAKINALGFEIDMVKNIISPRKIKPC